MLEQFKVHIARFGLCTPQDRILLAVSGGIDSMTLLHLFVQAGYNCTITHCNFQLRDEESEADEAFVIKQAESYGLPIYINKCDAQHKVKSEGVSVEMAARSLRYSWFNKLIKTGNFDKLATGHNLNDDQETFFIKLFRGSGLSGLKGIPLQRNYIIRPLMFASREEIQQYARENHILYRDDSTNATDLYLRNRIRHHLLPTLKKEFPGSLQALNTSIEKLKEEELLLSEFIAHQRAKLIQPKDDGFKIEKQHLLEMKPALFFHLLETYGFNRDTTDNILSAARSEQTGQLFHSDEYSLLCDRDCLFIKKNETTSTDTYSVSPDVVTLHNPVQLKMETLENHPKFVFDNNPDVAYFDAERLQYPLTLRHWEQGDTLFLSG